MEDCLVFVDDGFFGLVKKCFRKRNSKFSTSNHLLKIASRWVKLKAKDFD